MILYSPLLKRQKKIGGLPLFVHLASSFDGKQREVLKSCINFCFCFPFMKYLSLFIPKTWAPGFCPLSKKWKSYITTAIH